MSELTCAYCKAKMKKAREFFLPTYRMRVIDYYIHKGMQSKNLISSRQLAERCGVSQKTIIRLIERMKNYHLIPIEYDPQLHGWYYTEKNYCLPTIEVNDNDLFSVCIAQKALQQYGSSAESVGSLGCRQVAKCMIQCYF